MPVDDPILQRQLAARLDARSRADSRLAQGKARMDARAAKRASPEYARAVSVRIERLKAIKDAAKRKEQTIRFLARMNRLGITAAELLRMAKRGRLENVRALRDYRRREVLRMEAAGITQREIAAKLGITHGAVSYLLKRYKR